MKGKGAERGLPRQPKKDGVDAFLPTVYQATINLRVLAAASLFATKDKERYQLRGVCLEVEERAATYIATDGHRLIAYRDDLQPGEPDNSLEGLFVIPEQHCKVFKLDKEDTGAAKLSRLGERLRVSYGMLDFVFHPIDGYPHWRRALPAQMATGEVGQYNLKLLADFDKFARELELTAPFVACNGVEAPAWVWFSGYPHILGLMMPYRAMDEMTRTGPSWARGKGPYPRAQTDIEDVLSEPSPHTHEPKPEYDPQTGELADIPAE